MPNITEAQVFEALGVADTARTDAAATETAAEQTADAADTVREDAGASGEAGGNEEDTATEEPETEEAGAADGESGKKEPLSPEKRREFAAQRRREEQQAAIDEAVKKAVEGEQEQSKRVMNDFFERANLKNTVTGTVIKNLDEFNEWQRKFRESTLQAELKAGKLTPEGLESAISENPVIKRAEELIQKSEAEQKRLRVEAAQARVDAEIAEIGKLDPTIKNMADLLNMPNSKQFYEHVKKGNSFIDAFYLANRERLQTKAAESAKQQALTNARSKDHLKTPNARGEGAVSVPRDEMTLFRELMPKASDADIQAYYNKNRR